MIFPDLLYTYGVRFVLALVMSVGGLDVARGALL